jgi:tetratricopeptide (TPR) repeat protein
MDAEHGQATQRISSLLQLVRALGDRVCLLCQEKDNDECIALCREAMSLADTFKEHTSLSALSSILLARALGAIRGCKGTYDHHETSADEAIADERIVLCRQALTITSETNDTYPEVLVELASALYRKLDKDHLKEALSFLNKLKEWIRDDTHPLYVRHAVDMAACYDALADISQDPADAEEALVYAQKCFELCPRGHTQRLRACRTLCLTLHSNFLLTSDPSLALQGIDVCLEWLSIARQTGQPLWPMYDNLCLFNCYHVIGSGDNSNIDAAVRYGYLDIQHCPINNRGRARYDSRLSSYSEMNDQLFSEPYRMLQVHL